MPKVKDLTIEVAPALTDYAINERVGGPGVQPKRTLWQLIFDMFIAAGMPVRTYLSGIAAAGTVQGDATGLTKTLNRIDTVAAGTGVVNAATEAAGFERTVQNNGAGEDLLWYPFVGSRFYVNGTGAMAIDAPITISQGNQASVIAYTAGVLTLI